MSRSNFDGRNARTLILSAVAFGLVVSAAVPRAQQAPQQPATPAAGQQSAAPAAPAAPAQKPLMPVVASTLAAKPDNFVGENVTMMALVDQSLSSSAFVVDQDKTKPADKPVLVLAPRLNEPLELNTYVTVIGEVVKFDPTDAKVKDRLTGISPEALAQYTGKPAVVATSVINNAMNDIARRLAPPMSPEEEKLQAAMKAIASANGAFREIIEKSDQKRAVEQAVALKAAFATTEAFFKPHGKADAMGWAQDARKMAESIESAATGGRWDEVKTTQGNLGKTCGTCHGAYRERFDDGAFRAKLGPSTP